MGVRRLSVWILSLFLFSCNQHEQKHITKVRKNQKGVIISEITYYRDSVLDGQAKFYFPNGKLHFQTNYEMGKKNGAQKEYYANGNLKSEVQFADGKRDGPALFYFPDGKLQHQEYWLKGNIAGSSYWYYSNGKLNSYKAIDFEGNKRYIIEFDSIGNKTREEGKLIGQIASDGFIDTVQNLIDSVFVNEPFTGLISVATPPTSIVRIFLTAEMEKLPFSRIELPIKNSLASFKWIFKIRGIYSLTFSAEMTDSTGKVLMQDTVKTKVLVK